MKLDVYYVDAFADNVFSGNPAAVIFSDLDDEDIMQSIASENNLSETAFINQNNDINNIRWFSPTTEVNLCGHATLASGYVYCISVLGVTGERKVVFDRVKVLVEEVKKNTSIPVAVGFGVSNKSDVSEIGKFADGAIIGSALINKIRESKDDNIVDVAGKFISSLI